MEQSPGLLTSLGYIKDIEGYLLCIDGHRLFFFLPDIDECALTNGNCSHTCVNTAAGYKCECPEPELRLSLDNRTCYGR